MEIESLRGMTLERVEDWYHQGIIGQDWWEAYCHAWRTGAPRFSSELHAYRWHPAGVVGELATAIGCCAVSS